MSRHRTYLTDWQVAAVVGVLFLVTVALYFVIQWGA